MAPEVRAALDRLYAIRARPPKAMRGCPCCVDGDMRHALRGPREQLSAEQLGRYASKAMTTWGGPEDYEHFLPRILELSFERPPYMGFDDHALAGRLVMLDLERRWSIADRDALRTVLLVHWERCHDIDPADAFASEHYHWLANFGDLAGPLHERLWDWQTNPSPGARAALRHHHQIDADDGARRPAPKGWPDGDESIGARVAPWLRSLRL